MGEYTQAVSTGLMSLTKAVLGWRENSYTEPVTRRLWGRFPAATLGALILVATVGAPFFPSFSRIVGFIPPLVFLQAMPFDVTGMLWSVPAAFALVVAWRVRSFRDDAPENWIDQMDEDRSGRRIFEAAAIPVGAAGLVLGLGLVLVPWLVDFWARREVEWGSVGGWSYGLSECLMTVAVVAGVLSVNRSWGKAFGQLLGAVFTIGALRFALASALPWMTSWWAYLPIPGIERFANSRSPSFGLTIFNLAVVAVAWVSLREKAAAGLFWSMESRDEEDEGEPPLPPLPTS